MSGGSYDYLYGRVRDAANEIERRTKDMSEHERLSVRHPETNEWVYGDQAKELLRPTTEARLWFAKLLGLVSEAMHDIEWVDSGDYSPGDELRSIKKVAEFLEKAPFERHPADPAITWVRCTQTSDVQVPPGYVPLSVTPEKIGHSNTYIVFFRKI
jgi:hypothetical protein